MKLASLAVLYVISLVATYGAGKTMRVEHGRPIVLVSKQSVLVLEFLKQTAGDAVTQPEANIRGCHGQYRYRLFDGVSESIAPGEGTVAEILRTISRSPTGNQVEDAGSRTSIQAGEFHFGWSEARAGSRSWLYYQADSPIRFLQQPRSVDFEAIGLDLLRKYYSSQNVQEFSSAGQEAIVLGPGVFTGDFPDETPVSARIESSGIESGVFRIKLTDLAPTKNYVIESAYDLKVANWQVVHTFNGTESSHSWKDPIAKEVSTIFYRIREGL
jgi:hypothetical protein